MEQRLQKEQQKDSSSSKNWAQWVAKSLDWTDFPVTLKAFSR